MENNKFVFQEDGYWDSNGCSCCESYYMESFICTSHEDTIYGSLHSELECYFSSVLVFMGIDPDDYEHPVYQALNEISQSDLMNICKEYGIDVVIEYPNGREYE